MACRLLLALLLSVALSSCGPRTFHQDREVESPRGGGFEARGEEDEPDAEVMIQDDSVRFDPDAGPYEEVE